jgi:transcriptional regulator with PAS, ATPase and Fis domain
MSRSGHYVGPQVRRRIRLQPKLLRVLQDQTFTPVGGKRQIESNARIIASTNANLEEKVRKGEFRSDLFHRLNVFLIELPPLRERAADIPAFVRHFIEKYSPGNNLPEVAAAAMDSLVRYSWPGNVRELENVIRCAVATNKSDMIETVDLPSRVITAGPHATNDCEFNLKFSVQHTTREQIERALRESGGDAGEAAKLLHISKRTLYRRMKELNV